MFHKWWVTFVNVFSEYAGVFRIFILACFDNGQLLFCRLCTDFKLPLKDEQIFVIIKNPVLSSVHQVNMLKQENFGWEKGKQAKSECHQHDTKNRSSLINNTQAI